MRESKIENKKNNEKGSKIEDIKKEVEDVKKKSKNKKSKEDSLKEEKQKDKNNKEKENSEEIKESASKEALDVEKEEIEINKEQLEKIGNEISQNKKNSKNNEKKEARYKSIMKNICIAIFYIAYFGLVLLGKDKIPTIEFIRDIKTFIIIDLIASIALLEISYKKDNSSLFIYGIEMAFLGGFTILILDLFGNQQPNINIYISIIIGIVVVYTIIKSIIISVKNKKE